MSLLNIKRAGRPDNFQTPDWPVISLINILPKPLEGVVWDPCCGNGNIVKLLTRMNQDSFGTDVEGGIDFFIDWKIGGGPFDTIRSWDYIITNPPYSLKDKWLKRCYELSKPFALLMPITA